MKGSILFAVFPMLIAITMAADDKDPGDLVAARESYEKEFVYQIKPLQGKYRRALENFRNAFTRSGDLSSASEADEEIKSVFEWKNIPVEKGKRAMKNHQLNSLLQNFEEALEREVTPIKSRYKNELVALKERFASSNNLEAALSVDEEIKKIANSLPVEAGRIEYFSGLNKSEFEDWLEGQRFDFSGAFAGFTKLKFKDGTMSYLSGGKDSQYEFKVATNRALEVNGGQRTGGWTIEFSKDLQSGTFQTRDNTYPIRINPPLVPEP